jgi:hypothetical protein
MFRRIVAVSPSFPENLLRPLTARGFQNSAGESSVRLYAPMAKMKLGEGLGKAGCQGFPKTAGDSRGNFNAFQRLGRLVDLDDVVKGEIPDLRALPRIDAVDGR